MAELVDVVALLGTLAMLGRMGDDALYIRSLYQPVAVAMLGATVAFVITNQVCAAISCGRNRPTDVLPVAASLARVWLGAGVVLCGLLAVAAPTLAELLGVSPRVRGDFVAFVRWTCLAELSVIGSALCASCLRGFGRARSATAVVVSSALARICCLATLGLGTGIGYFSVPISSGCAGTVGLALGLPLLHRAGLWYRGLRLPWRREVLGQLRRIGVPVAGTFVLIACYNLAILWVVRGFGPLVVSGFSVAVNLQALVFLPGTVLGAAIAIVLNQQRGAGRHAQISQTLYDGLELTVVVYVVVALGVWLAADPLGAAMSGTRAVAAETSSYLRIVALTYVIQGPVLAALTLLEQIGRGVRALLLNLVYFATVVLVGWLAVTLAASITTLYVAIAACNFLGVSVVVITVRTVRRMHATAGPTTS